jgi:hypothetical protein
MAVSCHVKLADVLQGVRRPNMTRPTGKRAARVVLLPVIAVVAFGTLAACSRGESMAKVCGRLRVAEQDYAALRTHSGQPDFNKEASVYASELDALVKSASHLSNAVLKRAPGEARSAFAASRKDAAQPGPATQLLADEQRFAYAMAEALAACQPGGRLLPPSTTSP